MTDRRCGRVHPKDSQPGVRLPCLKIQIPLQQVDLRLYSLETLPSILKSVLRASLFGVGLAGINKSSTKVCAEKWTRFESTEHCRKPN